MKLNLPTTSLTQAVFNGCGLLTTFASVKGTHDYILTESNDQLMAIAGAGVLGVVIYAGWDIVFNHTGWKRKAAAGVFAVAASLISSYTIYELNNKPALDEAKTKTEQASTTLLQQQQAAALAATQQQANIQKSIDDLQALNKADQRTITANPKSKAVDSLRTNITERTQQIIDMQKLSASYANTLIKQNQPTPTATTAPAHDLDVAMLLRASLYDGMTAVLLLMGSFYRTHKRAAENAQIQQLQTVAADTQAIILKLESVIAHADHRANDIATSMTDWATKAHAHSTALETLVDQSPQQQAALTDLHRKIDQQLTAAATLTRSLDASTTTATDCTTDLQNIMAQADECTSNLQKVAGRATAYIAQAQMYDVHSDVRTSACTSTRTPSQSTRESQKDSQTLTDDSALELLKSQKIPPDELGKITTTILMEATGFGRRKAEKLRDKAVDAGILVAEPAGKGSTFRYADQNTQPTTTHSDNVVTLKRSA